MITVSPAHGYRSGKREAEKSDKAPLHALSDEALTYSFKSLERRRLASLASSDFKI